jgi:molybdenum cofactor cytidylyltransferase
MGSPKPLLRIDGVTFVDRLAAVLGVRCAPVIVVLGHQAETIRAGMDCDATVVVNRDFARGQLSSLHCGLAAVPGDCDGVLFTPVDYPAIRAETVERLADAFAAGGCQLAVPRHAGRRGHPVCCHRSLIPEFLGLPPDGQARDVIHRHVDETKYVDVSDPGILKDIDDPVAYRELVSP